MPQQRGAHNLREFPIRVAAKRIHLPQAILRCNVALRKKHILLRQRVNMRYSVQIAPHRNRRRKACLVP